MLTCHSLGFIINTRTVKNFTVDQAETISMCTMNISDHEEQHIMKFVSITLFPVNKFNQAAALLASKHQKPNQISTKNNINYAQYTDYEAAQKCRF